MLLWLSVAYAIEPIAGADTVGRGTVGAWPDDNAAIAVAPAAIGLDRRYDVAIQGAIGPDLGWDVSLTAVDSRTSKLAMGVGYQLRQVDPEPTLAELPGWIADGDEIVNRRRTHEGVVTLAIPLGEGEDDGPPKFAIGLEGDFRLVQHDRLGDHLAVDPGFGLGFRPKPWLSITASGTGLVPGGAFGADPTAHVGLGVFDSKVGRVGAEGAVAFGDTIAWTARFGAEKVFAEKAAVRLGWHREGATGRSALSVGGSVMATTGAFDLALEVPTGPRLDGETGGAWFARGFSVRVGVRLKT